MKQICIIVPVYNEELSIDTFFNTFLKFNEALVDKGYSASVLFVDDGSKDKTPTILNHLITEHTNCKALIFSRNFGKEAALFAGLEHAEADLMIPMDVDL